VPPPGTDRLLGRVLAWLGRPAEWLVSRPAVFYVEGMPTNHGSNICRLSTYDGLTHNAQWPDGRSVGDSVVVGFCSASLTLKLNRVMRVRRGWSHYGRRQKRRHQIVILATRSMDGWMSGYKNN